MRPRFRIALAAVLLTAPAGGCGTLTNMTAPPGPSSGYRAFGPTACEPFGGVQRSVLCGSAPLMAGPIGLPLAIVAVGVDAPLSLAGDLVTLPLAYGRSRGERWATWWGQQGAAPALPAAEAPAPVGPPPGAGEPRESGATAERRRPGGS